MLPGHRLKVVLVEPEIPQNAGNVARLCAVTGAQLHLVRPLGFVLSDRHLKRAALDYWADAHVQVHESWQQLRSVLGAAERYWLCTARAHKSIWDMSFQSDDWLVFGRETAGLPESWLAAEPARQVAVPMAEGARCLNLATAAGIVLFEALRQLYYQ